VSGFSDADVGSVAAAGSSSLSSGTYTVRGSGADIWSTADGMYYACQPLSGDGQIIARVKSVTPTQISTKAGIMLRETNDPGSKNVLLALTPSNTVKFQQRTSVNGSSSTSVSIKHLCLNHRQEG